MSLLHTDILELTSTWRTVLLYSHFFSSIWSMWNIQSVVDYDIKTQWPFPIILAKYGVNFDRRMLDKTLYVANNSTMSQWQFLHTLNVRNTSVHLTSCFTSCIDQLCLNLISTWQFINLSTALSTCKRTRFH